MKKVLVVDDNPEMLLLIQILLDRHGFLVESVTHASQLEKQIFRFEPGLLIIDVNLEDGDGRLLCKKLKSNPATCHIPIILFSADALLIGEFREYSADHFISKPIEQHEFVAHVNQFFNHSHTSMRL